MNTLKNWYTLIEHTMSRRQTRLNVILIGDRCVDEYHYGTVNRLSPEAPVPIFVLNRIESKNGMAANVEENLKKLGVGVKSYFGQRSVKVRMIDERSNQHLMRIDTDTKSTPLEFKSITTPHKVDAFVVSDYDKGFVSYELVEQLIETKLPVFVDTKKTDLARFDGALVKINALEYSMAKTFPKDLIVTMGKQGAMWRGNTYSAPSIEITDVCGAGDTFLSAFVYQYLSTNSIEDAIRFAIRASSVTVQNRGVYAPSLEEILC